MKLLWLLTVSFSILLSCQTIKVVKKMNAEEATYETWQNGDGKTVTFIPMVHAGKKVFYDDVKRLITERKQQGYIVFFEGIKTTATDKKPIDPESLHRYIDYAQLHSFDTTTIDDLVYLLKFKRMVGIIPDSAAYVTMLKSTSITKNTTFQPMANDLGGTESDQNVDVTIIDMVNAYEKKFGAIDLEQIEFAIPLHQPLPSFRRLKKSKTIEIILDHRDDNLSNSILKSPNQKIVVVYGMAHKEGTFRNLKESDPSWKVIL